METADAVFWILLRASAQAAVVALLVLAVIRCFANRLSPAWRHFLWLLVAMRLALPFMPGSDLSVFNLVRFLPSQGQILPQIPAVEWIELPSPDAVPAAHPLGAEEISQGQLRRPESSVFQIGFPPWRSLSVNGCRSSGWPGRLWPPSVFSGIRSGSGAGSAGYGRSPIMGLSRFSRTAGPGCACGSPVALYETDQVTSPALLGALRPRILLPAGTLAQFSVEELRCVFLHELAHLKRCDILVGWGTAFLSVLHWFNPLVRFAFRRAWAEREESLRPNCAFTHGRGASERYGRTLIKILERSAAPQPLIAVVGILEDRSIWSGGSAISRGSEICDPLVACRAACLACFGGRWIDGLHGERGVRGCVGDQARKRRPRAPRRLPR